MAKFDYDRVISQTVLPALEKYGNPVILTRDADMSLWERTYDPVTEEFSWENRNTGQIVQTEPEDEKYTGDGVFTNIDSDMLENSLVKSSDKMLLIQAIPSPKVGDRFTDHSGKVYQYVADMNISPGGTSVLYKIAVRI